MTSFQLHNPTFNINNAFATLNNISWFRCYAGSWCLLDLFFFSICPVHREHCQSWLYTASRHLAAFRALPIIMLSMFCYPLTQNCMLPTDFDHSISLYASSANPMLVWISIPQFSPTVKGLLRYLN